MSKTLQVTGRPPYPPLQTGNELRIAGSLDPVAGVRLGRDLVDAVNVALLVGKPLLLTGEPGVGKTVVAYVVGRELGLNVLRFDVKSRSVASDLFYRYDYLQRLHAASNGRTSADPRDFIQFNALGQAILDAMPAAGRRALLPDGFEAGSQPQRSVVLIDGIDNGTRDFANDLLSELETLAFRIPELRGQELQGDRAMAPVVFITSNSERALPDAFLRRCCFHHIAFPDAQALAEIVASRLGPALSMNEGLPRLCRDAVEFFGELRRLEQLSRPPATAELLDWIKALRDLGADFDAPLSASGRYADASLVTLAKTSEDRQIIQAALHRRMAG